MRRVINFRNLQIKILPLFVHGDQKDESLYYLIKIKIKEFKGSYDEQFCINIQNIPIPKTPQKKEEEHSRSDEIEVVEDEKEIEETVIESTETDQEEEIVEVEEIEVEEVEEDIDVPFNVIENVPVFPGC